MSRSGRQADVGGREVAEALRDPNVTQLMHVCGEHIDLVVDVVLQNLCQREKVSSFMDKPAAGTKKSNNNVWLRPLDLALQSRYADCRCSPLGRLVKRNAVISGSMAEGLQTPGRPPKYQTSSDQDVMIELGPVHWTFPGTEETSPVEDISARPTTATTAEHGGQDSDPTPRLVIEETENPGFVLVLQERRDDCPHQERRPFKAKDVTRYFSDYQLVTNGHGITQRSTNGPACSFVQQTNKVGGISDNDDVPSLHVPVWWLSDEFFTRHRRYNWPPKAMLDDIRRYGLHLVPVGAPGSSTEELQWRLSFSRAEVLIASHLTDLQGCAVIAFKICKTALGEDGKVIKSYFIKTALFWLCEQTQTEEWKSVTQVVLKLLDYLDEAVSKGNLPCYFWSRINLLRFVSGADRKAMKKALKTIRQYYRRLLAHEVRLLRPLLQKMLTQQTRRLSERQLLVCLTRWLIALGVFRNIVRHLALSTTTLLDELLPVLVRSYTPAEVMRLLRNYSHWYRVQTALYRALTVAPADVTSQVHFSASGDGFDWDAAPLLQLLTEDDLKVLLGDPDAVRSWLRRHHQLPETGRPAGTLPADLRSPQDLCDLLLNIPLLTWVLRESVPDEWAGYKRSGADMSANTEYHVASTEQERQKTLQLAAHWRRLADLLQTELGMDHQTARRLACRAGVEWRQFCDDPETLAEHKRIYDTLPDPWQLKKFILPGSP